MRRHSPRQKGIRYLGYVRGGMVAFVVLVALGGARAQHRDAGEADASSGPRSSVEVPSALALWGAAANDVWAVGRAGTAWHWGGAQWSRVRLPSRASFESIWGRAADDIWIAGSRTDADQATVLHWDGHAWSDARFSAGNAELVAGSDDGKVWVAIRDGSVWSWADGAWKQQVRAECPTPPCFREAACGGACVWARFHTAGGGHLLQPPPWSGTWDGRALVRGQKPPAPTGHTFGGTRASLLLLETGPLASPSWSEVRRWNGARWTPLGKRRGPLWIPRGIDKGVTLSALWGASDDDVWAVGTGGTVLHWNGTRWRSVDASTRVDLKYLWGAAANDIWASGGDDPGSGRWSPGGGAAVMLHWNGTRWQPVEVPWHRPP